MMYEIQIKRADGSAAKEAFTAANDKKAVQRIPGALDRHARQDVTGTYRLVDANGREVVREITAPKAS